jgi:heme exporter protein C
MSWLKTWWHRLGSPRWFFEISGAWAAGLLTVGLIGIAVGLVWGLAIAPPDYLQGDSFRIMYLHVPTAMLAESCYILMGIAGAVLLIWRMKLADMVVAAAAPIGATFCVLALLTGAIWGRPTWGTWWGWDGRTTSMLVLLFLYFGVMALRQAVPREETAGRAAAILAVVGMVDIPIIKYSVDWWLTLHQPATFKLTSAPSMPAEMYLPLLISALGFYAFFAGVLFLGVGNEILQRESRTQWVGDLIRDRFRGRQS